MLLLQHGSSAVMLPIHSMVMMRCWAGMETESEDQAEEAARKILSQGIHSVLVKRGTNGSLLIDRDGDVNLQPIFEVEKVWSLA